MTLLEALFLGIVQGITEFLPISSSGHLVIAQALMGNKNLDQYILFDLFAHLGTLLAIFIVFHKKIVDIIFHDRTTFYQILLGISPLFFLVFALKPIKALFNQPEYVGYFFLLTAFLLFTAMKLKALRNSDQLTQTKWRDAFIIGIFQALAVLPGVSRSGSTISAARILGWEQMKAVTFSFLLAIPAILGGTLIESLSLFLGKAPNNLSIAHYVMGFLSSFIVGLFALKILIRLAMKDRYMFFVWYCLFIGIFSIVYFNT